MAENRYIYTLKLNDKMSGTLKKAGISGTQVYDKLDKGQKKLNKNATDFGTIMRSVGFAAIGYKIAGLGKSAIMAASDFEETSSKFSVVFQDVSKAADKMSKDLVDNYGLSSLASKTLLSDTGDLLSGFGFTGKMSLDLSGKVNKLAVDLASFTNFSGGAKGASEALTKALLGERESVKALGIAILEKDVKAKVKAMDAAGKLIGMTERQKKAYATFAIAVEQSKNAVGDYSRTSKGFANRLRLLQNRWQDMLVKIGNKLKPFAATVVDFLLKTIRGITKLAQIIREANPVIKGLFVALAAGVTVYAAITAATWAWRLAQTALNISMAANPIGLIIAGIVGLIALMRYLADGTIDYSENWDRFVEGMSLSFKVMGASLALTWSIVQRGFNVGFNNIKKGWYEVQKLWDEEGAKKGLQELQKDTTASYIKVAEKRGKLNELIKRQAELANLGIITKDKKSLAETKADVESELNGGSLGGPGGTGLGLGGTTTGIDATSKAIAGGGSRPTNITINLNNLVESINITAANVTDAVKNAEEQVQEALLRVLNSANGVAYGN